MTHTLPCRSATRLLLGIVVVVSLLGSPASARLDEEFDAPYRAAEYFEINFLAQMINHHGMAVAMADLCGGRAVHQDLVTFCEQMAAAQGAEIAQMQTWLEQWFGLQHQPMMDDSGMQQLAMLGATTGEEFEVMFLRMMIAHHDGAIKSALPCTQRAVHEELAELCADMHDMQMQEITQMRGWLCNWYDLCSPDDQSATVATTWGAVKSLYR